MANDPGLMLETIEYRFQKTKTPFPIQWLTDNGPLMLLMKLYALLIQLGFLVSTTPSYSPESNGMAEAFVKIFKRDYVWVSDTSNALVVFKQLPSWFEAYNEHAPHKALKKLAPRQFID